MTTAPTAPPELLDLDKLEALARAATPGGWIAKPHGRIVGGPLRHYVNGSAQQQLAMLNVTIHDQDGDDVPDRQQANTEFIAGANPATVLALIALARRAQPEGEAPQVEPPRMTALESREYLVTFMEKHFTDKTYHRYIRGERDSVNLATDFAWQMARALRMLEHAPAATLSPLCGAQHADSGKEVGDSVADFDAWMAKRGPLCAGGHPSRSFIAGHAYGVRAAQQAAAPGALDADEMTRLRRLMAALGHSDAFELTDDYVRGILCTLLGQAAGELERSKLAAVSSAPGTPEAPKQPAHGHRDDYYLLANGRRLGLEPISRVRNMPNWVLAMELFATGSTSAHQICHDAGIDPDSTTIQRAAAPKGGV